jgi:phosphoribosylformylglycinamidine synthase
MIRKGIVASAHDCSEGGLAVALTESAVGREKPLGFDVRLDDAIAPVPLLFGEAQGRIVVSCAPDDAEAVVEIAARHGVPARLIGTVRETGHGLRIAAGDHHVQVDTAAARAAFTRALPRRMDQTLTSEAE